MRVIVYFGTRVESLPAWEEDCLNLAQVAWWHRKPDRMVVRHDDGYEWLWVRQA